MPIPPTTRHQMPRNGSQSHGAQPLAPERVFTRLECLRLAVQLLSTQPDANLHAALQIAEQYWQWVTRPASAREER